MAFARAAAALPFGCSLGSGRLPVGALPGHGGVVLAVRRDGTGRGGVVAIALKVPAWIVKATRESDDRDSAEEFQLVRELRAEIDRTKTGTRSSEWMLSDVGSPLSKRDQITLEGYANGSFDLWANVANRLKPSTETKLHEGLRLCGETLRTAVVRSRNCSATWKNVAEVVEALDLLRRLLSSALEALLRQEWLRFDALDYDDAEMGIIQVLLRTYVLVGSDIDSMLADAN